MATETLAQTPERPERAAFEEYLREVPFGCPMWQVIADVAGEYALFRANMQPYDIAAVVAVRETKRIRRNEQETGLAYRAAEKEFTERFGDFSALYYEISDAAWDNGTRTSSDINESFRCYGAWLQNAIDNEANRQMEQRAIDAR